MHEVSCYGYCSSEKLVLYSPFIVYLEGLEMNELSGKYSLHIPITCGKPSIPTWKGENIVKLVFAMLYNMPKMSTISWGTLGIMIIFVGNITVYAKC